MKKYFFFVLFGALYSTTVAQNLPTKIFKLDYFGNKTLLLEGETSFVEGEEIIAFLLATLLNSFETDTISDFLFETKDSITTLSYIFFKTEDIGLVDFEDENKENKLYLLIEIQIFFTTEQRFLLKGYTWEEISFPPELFLGKSKRIESLLEHCAQRMTLKNLGSRKN